MLIQLKQDGTEYVFNSSEITTAKNTTGNCRAFQRPLEVWSWGSVLQGKDMSGSVFKVVTKKITGIGFIASLWAMNDLSLSPSGIDSRLRQTTNDCWWKCIHLSDCSGWACNTPPASCTRFSLQRPHPPRSSSAGLVCTHLEVLPRGYLYRSFATCFSFPEIYVKQTEYVLWHYPPFK